MNRNEKLRATIAGMAIVGGSVAVAMPALADGVGNTVHNCYGRYFTRDWEQSCWSGGAAFAGRYHSDADCDNQPDKTLNVDRSAGSTDTVDGADCTYSVGGVDTSYFG